MKVLLNISSACCVSLLRLTWLIKDEMASDSYSIWEIGLQRLGYGYLWSHHLAQCRENQGIA